MRQDYYLLIIRAIAFTAAPIGYQHRRRHRPGDTGHIADMGIAYAAMLTAFYVDNSPHLPLWDRLPTLTFWLLPSAIGAPIIIRAPTRRGWQCRWRCGQHRTDFRLWVSQARRRPPWRVLDRPR